MKELTIVFTKSKKKFPIGSWIIRWWTNKPYSHVARGLSIKDWGYGFYQANEGKVNYEHEDIFNKKHEIVHKRILLVSEEIYDSIGRACWKEAGQPYGTMQNLGILFVDLLAKIGIKINNPFKIGRNCSELLYSNVLKIMFPELDYRENMIKPHQIDKIIQDKYFNRIKM